MRRFDLDVGKSRARARFREFLRTRLSYRKDATVLCFPGEHGLEIEQVYRKLGIRDVNIYGVERDAKAAKAIREKYPEIYVHEGEMLDFVTKYEGPAFQVVSLDFCGYFSPEKVAILTILSFRGLLADRCVIHTNFLAGRESPEDQQWLRGTYGSMLRHSREIYGSIGDPIIREQMQEVLTDAKTDALQDLRGDAVTYGLLNTLTYMVPTAITCRDLNLTFTRGQGVYIRPGAEITPGEGSSITISHAELVNSGNIFAIPLAVKHEAIQSINREIVRRDIASSARALARSLATDDVSFLDYHLGRTLVMAFFDKCGQPDLPTAMERYSYVSASGKRMVSDFLQVRQLRDELEALPLAVAPYHRKGSETNEHLFRLHPDPAGFDSAEAYVNHLMRTVVQPYARIIAKTLCNQDQWPDRSDLGGGEAVGLDEEAMKARVVALIRRKKSDDEILRKVPYISVGTLRALRAHETRGSYGRATSNV